jgi:hypothetical protein
VQLNHLEQQ